VCECMSELVSGWVREGERGGARASRERDRDREGERE